MTEWQYFLVTPEESAHMHGRYRFDPDNPFYLIEYEWEGAWQELPGGKDDVLNFLIRSLLRELGRIGPKA